MQICMSLYCYFGLFHILFSWFFWLTLNKWKLAWQNSGMSDLNWFLKKYVVKVKNKFPSTDCFSCVLQGRSIVLEHFFLTFTSKSVYSKVAVSTVTVYSLIWYIWFFLGFCLLGAVMAVTTRTLLTIFHVISVVI